MRMMNKELSNVRICKDTCETATELGVSYKFGTDYTLFSNESVIPRLTMSYGCLNNCKFCIVPHGNVISVPQVVIRQQAESFKPLNYKLIYIDDKTFGQSDNYRYIAEISKIIDKEDFEGFIVQTTAPMLIGKGQVFKDIGVRVAEIGLETYNDEILRKYNKPCSERVIRMSVDAAKSNDIKLIANLIIGMEEETDETYQNTYDYVMPLLESGDLIGINPAIYTDYNNKENLGEIDFINDGKTALHRKWWDKFNTTAMEILSN
jgi:radical SAM superfamily enzyme YgiQ (UPF0313 family)